MKSVNSDIYIAYTQERLSCRDIANKFNISQVTVYNILKNHNTVFRDKSTANKIFSDELLVKLYNLGLSCSQIGKILGIHPSTIVKRFDKLKFSSQNKESCT